MINGMKKKKNYKAACKRILVVLRFQYFRKEKRGKAKGKDMIVT